MSADTAASSAEARDAALELLAWMEARDWRGHDPFDLLLSPWALPLRPFRWPGVLWIQLGRRSPLDLRRLLRVPVQLNPKALAMGALGCLRLADAGVEGARGTAARLVARLLEEEHPGGGWGYPFPWANRHFHVPAGMPSGVVTAFVTWALLEAERSGARPNGVPPAALHEAVLRAARFVHTRLHRIHTPIGPMLSYTPRDTRGVHNASVLAATVLARGSALAGGDAGWAEEARAVGMTTVRAQRPDGSWPYGISRRDGFVDSYHTGYILSALSELDARIGLKGARSAVERGYAAWRAAFLTGPAVATSPGRLWPVELHAVAQGILTLLEAGDVMEARRIAGWAMARARRPDGAFVCTWRPRCCNTIAYLRWTQAWMFHALAAIAAT